MQLGALPPAFAGLDPADSQEASAYLQTFELAAGDLLMEQGEEDFTLAFIVQGAVQLLDGTTRVGGAGTRDMLGEVELFGQVPRSVTVEASSPTRLQVLAYEHWLELCERGNPAVFNIERFAYRRMGDRLRFLADAIGERSPGGQPYPDPPAKGLMGALSGLFSGGTPRVDPASVLAHSAMFDWASQEILEDIGRYYRVERAPARAALCRQGQVEERSYVIVDGQVDLMVGAGDGSAEVIASLGPGQAFGDTTMASNSPRPLSCICQTDTIVLTLERNNFATLFGADDPAGSVFRQSMLRNLVLQLLASQQRFVDLERMIEARTEAELRGSPSGMVWRD